MKSIGNKKAHSLGGWGLDVVITVRYELWLV